MKWRALIGLAKLVGAFLAIVIGTLIFLVLAAREADAQPRHPELCTPGMDLNRNGVVDWKDYARLLVLMGTAWGKDVRDCPYLPGRSACTAPDARGKFTCWTLPEQRDDGLWFYYGQTLEPL